MESKTLIGVRLPNTKTAARDETFFVLISYQWRIKYKLESPQTFKNNSETELKFGIYSSDVT